MPTKAWIIASGNGYLLDAVTGEMISAGLRDEGALQARRFKTLRDAEWAARQIEERGFEARVIELEVIKHGEG